MTDEEKAEFLRQQGYLLVRKLVDGRWIGIASMIYTVGLCVDLGEVSYSGRYCYKDLYDAIGDFWNWDGMGDPPGKWIKYKGSDGERSKMASIV